MAALPRKYIKTVGVLPACLVNLQCRGRLLCISNPTIILSGIIHRVTAFSVRRPGRRIHHHGKLAFFLSVIDPCSKDLLIKPVPLVRHFVHTAGEYFVVLPIRFCSSVSPVCADRYRVRNVDGFSMEILQRKVAEEVASGFLPHFISRASARVSLRKICP